MHTKIDRILMMTALGNTAQWSMQVTRHFRSSYVTKKVCKHCQRERERERERERGRERERERNGQ